MAGNANRHNLTWNIYLGVSLLCKIQLLNWIKKNVSRAE